MNVSWLRHRKLPAELAMTDWVVRVPASSANLGPGFDVLGMALTLHAEFGVGSVPDQARLVDEHHPAAVAFRRIGGVGPLWVRSPIPIGRGLGFSGAMRVGGAVAALAQRGGDEFDIGGDAVRRTAMSAAAALEGHADNVAASLYGGVVVAAADTVMRIPLAFDPVVVVWVPDATTTSTNQSRTQLASTVDRSDAVFNLGRLAMLIAACVTGDVKALRAATEDRLHQADRMQRVPESALALEAALDAGAWAAWLSGSGPTVAMMCDSSHADEIVAALPASGHSKQLRIDHDGAIVMKPDQAANP